MCGLSVFDIKFHYEPALKSVNFFRLRSRENENRMFGLPVAKF